VIESPAGDELTVGDEKMAERFNARQSDYVLKVYPGESIVKVTEFMDAVRTGAVEMCDVGWGIFGGKDARLTAQQLPFMFNNAEAEAAVAEDIVALYEPVMKENFNAKPLGFYFNGALDYVGVKPVKSLADMKGMLIGAPDPVVGEALQYVAPAVPDKVRLAAEWGRKCPTVRLPGKSAALPVTV